MLGGGSLVVFAVVFVDGSIFEVAGLLGRSSRYIDDISFCLNKLQNTPQHTHITQGPLTTSDHIPIILDISTTPILARAPPRPNLTKVNWDEIKNKINSTIKQQNLKHASLEKINTAIDD
ncbi:hypothetical protein E2C01_039610 [Portunus trituberculatus]|uniref:Endonuclease/exonuclease/phosphatase domain-containing protein n=1 Tax=Portunus trituberculatus TaxID=210409 RepID=A0A5B7FNH1_PORTR|nr:hypothetical protein [Portunus trituberculatus]